MVTRTINRILFALLIPMIPLVCVSVAVNIVARLPDVYRYEFNRNQVIKEVGLDATPNDMAEFVSAYMFGREDEFQLVRYYLGREQAIFGLGEAAVMSRVRSLLNAAAMAAGGLVVLIAAIYAALLKQGRKEALRFAYKAGMVFYAFVAAGMVAGLCFEVPRNLLFGRFFMYGFEETDLLPRLLPPVFFFESAAVVIVISLVILAAAYSLTKRLTRPDRMFY